MTNKVTMPEPVAYRSKESPYLFILGGPEADGFEGLITTDQAEAYADARVREALEEAVAVAEKRSAVLPHYSDIVRGYADGRKAAASEIRALIPPAE